MLRGTPATPVRFADLALDEPIMKTLKLVTPARSAEREALADAIAAHADARQAADKARSGAERARGAMAAAKAKHGTAESVLNEGKEQAIGAATREDAAAPAPDLTGLRRAEADAADDVAIAAEAVHRAETALEDPERAERYAREHLDEAADAVLAGEIDRAEAAVDEAHRAWTCSLLVAQRLAQSVSPFTASQTERNFRNFYGTRALSWPGPVNGADDAIMQAKARVLGPWEAARAALLADPDAALPEVP